ncbi:hypothetical protein K438DRAFT_1845399 [Mycena galopus ATCC 62051]|nr:hypothetical protein K438DRAFT_1845399 [Mycena galopus ATCC 62051]
MQSTPTGAVPSQAVAINIPPPTDGDSESQIEEPMQSMPIKVVPSQAVAPTTAPTPNVVPAPNVVADAPAKRVRRKRHFAPCDGCGEPVAEADREKVGMFLECTQVSCETRWHHRACFPSDDSNSLKNWMCEVCTDQRANKKRK